MAKNALFKSLEFHFTHTRVKSKTDNNYHPNVTYWKSNSRIKWNGFQLFWNRSIAFIKILQKISIMLSISLATEGNRWRCSKHEKILFHLRMIQCLFLRKFNNSKLTEQKWKSTICKSAMKRNVNDFWIPENFLSIKNSTEIFLLKVLYL